MTAFEEATWDGLKFKVLSPRQGCEAQQHTRKPCYLPPRAGVSNSARGGTYPIEPGHVTPAAPELAKQKVSAR